MQELNFSKATLTRRWLFGPFLISFKLSDTDYPWAGKKYNHKQNCIKRSNYWRYRIGSKEDESEHSGKTNVMPLKAIKPFFQICTKATIGVAARIEIIKNTA